MARELHDDPLQAIAGVIQRLEQPAPDTEAARESLRDVAARLRGVATELHPPVLDDLGLVPAIESAARAAGEFIRVDVRVEDQTGYSVAERPPSDVEVAVFRIVQEAIANAVKHSQAKRITVSGRVAAREVALVVVDDGVGFSVTRANEAVREGHFGMTSMSQRAGSIGAAFDVARPAIGGTSISIRWSA
jgi:signal transduction histidine kinase